MKTKIIALGLALAALGLVGHAQTITPVSVSVADDTGIAFLVRYVGSGTSATIAANQSADTITFQVAAAAYTGFECPVSGALGGIIDTTNAACNTLGEVIDTINGNCTGCSSDFRAVLIDGLRTDASQDTLLDVGATQVTRTDGLQINFDTSTSFIDSRALVANRTNIAGYLGGPPNYRLLENPYAGTQPFLRYYSFTSTYGSGTSLFTAWSVKPSNKVAGSEVVTSLFGPQASGATTVAKNWDFLSQPLSGRPNEKLIVRTVNSAAMASTTGFGVAELH